MNGKDAVEHDDPDAIKTGFEAPSVFCKLIEIKEGAPFSIDITLSRGIRHILTSDDSALMAVVHLGSQEVIRHLVTKKTLGSGKALRHRFLLRGVYEKDDKLRTALKRFRFATSDMNDNIPEGIIKVDVYIVKLLSQPEIGHLVDITSSGPPPQAIMSVSRRTPNRDVFKVLTMNSFEPNKTKKSQAADTYDINKLNRGPPLASIIFKYQTKATKLFDDLTLSDPEEEKTEMNRLCLPLQPKGFLVEKGEKSDHGKTEKYEAVSHQSGRDTKSTVFRKRKAVSAFDEMSPPRPRKMIALSE
ncbi:uncharacterized protein GLRG_05249 [Colletotrichum graminicola M1.001]|uniref:Uncharacterized protein n=1 Tax=Colletotrichum graminicola (strain M1.001 / M2 / FGSC 10212) TaxID=645133 RepID=E3QGW7_COLGM|nr:uncharacterized protein GLRG_05249 [Colletotrichum graminicola M1.001]EFQ30105.1 hypothetical protein GLRG_05249 [Colletotrichum graminicola M1.001]